MLRLQNDNDYYIDKDTKQKHLIPLIKTNKDIELRICPIHIYTHHITQ